MWQVATGKAHSLFLTTEGQVLACGSNSAGQCGVGKGKESVTSPQLISYLGPSIVQVSRTYIGTRYYSLLNLFCVSLYPYALWSCGSGFGLLANKKKFLTFSVFLFRSYHTPPLIPSPK